MKKDKGTKDKNVTAQLKKSLYDESLIVKNEQIKNKSSNKVPKSPAYEPIQIISPFTGHNVNNAINNQFTTAKRSGSETLENLSKNRKSTMKKNSKTYKSLDDYADKQINSRVKSNNKTSSQVDYDKVAQQARLEIEKEQKHAKRQAELDPTISFPKEIGMGEYSAQYFLKISQVIKATQPDTVVTMQYHQMANNVTICGIKHVLELLKNFTNFHKLKIFGLHDGDVVKAREPFLKITGPYFMFGYLESVMTGILRRMSSIATNAKALQSVANPTPVIFMGDRQDLFYSQPFDGYAAKVGGIKYQVTQRQLLHWKEANASEEVLFASMPHSFVQMHAGDLVAACKAYLKVFPNERLIALVDYNNDVVNDSIKVAKALGDKLFAVRVDTSSNMTDQFFTNYTFGADYSNEYGVTPNLIKGLRNALNLEGYTKVKIFVSGGFNKQKISEFKAAKAVVDAYGVGTALFNNKLDFSLNAVRLNGVEHAKKGVRDYPSDRLISLV